MRDGTKEEEMQQHFTDKHGRQIVAPGPFRIVDRPDEFAQLTRQGWGLVFTYQEQAVVNVMTFVRAELAPGSLYPTQTWDEVGEKMVTVPPGHILSYQQAVVQRQRFVLKEDVEPALTAAAFRVAECEAAVAKAAEAAARAEAEAAELRAATALAERTNDALARSERERGDLRERAHKLERAIATLRKELGEARLREVLGE